MNSTNEPNPYSPPVAESVTDELRPADSDALHVIAKETFIAWEKLRPLYVVALAVVMLVMCFVLSPFEMMGLLIIVPAAIFANICYLLGPAVDTYIRWLGYRKAWPRLAMFAVGTCFSAFLAVMVLVQHLK